MYQRVRQQRVPEIHHERGWGMEDGINRVELEGSRIILYSADRSGASTEYNSNSLQPAFSHPLNGKAPLLGSITLDSLRALLLPVQMVQVKSPARWLKRRFSR